MIDLRRNNIEAGTKQWMGCIYAGQRRIDVSPSALLRMRGVLVDMLREDRKRFLADTSQTKGSYGEMALLHVLLV
jgi:hypothetical protein